MNESRLKFELFNSDMEIIAYDLEPNNANFILENIHMEALRLENIFNPYDKNSEFSRLITNKKIKPSKELFLFFEKLVKYYESFLTDYPSYSFFVIREADIGLSKDLIELYDIDFNFSFDDLIKGFIVDLLILEMKAEGIISGFIDSSGDLVTFGERYEVVSIPSPRNNLYDNICVKIEDSSISTLENKKYSSVTVISKDFFLSEFYLSIISNFTIDEIKSFSEKYSNVKIYLVTLDKKEFEYNDFLQNERIVKIKEKEIRKTRAS